MLVTLMALRGEVSGRHQLDVLLAGLRHGRALPPAFLGAEPDDPAGQRHGQRGQLLALARAHGVSVYLYRCMRTEPAADAMLLAALRRDFQRFSARDIAIRRDLSHLARCLDAAGVRWLLFKGPVLADTVYPEPDMRVYGDLDVLVDATVFPRALRALEDAGARVLEQNWGLVHREMRGQVHVRMGLGTIVDLHWHVLNRAVVRDAFDITTSELFRRRATVQLRTSTVETFGEVDTLLHLCLHCALSGGHRLLWFKDIDEFVRSRDIDWAALLDTARHWRARTAVTTVLSRCRDLLGTSVPADIVPNPAVRAVEAVLRPLPASTVRRVWTQSLRDTAGRTVAALAPRLVVRRGAESAVVRPDGPKATDAQAGERRAYLADVGDARSHGRRVATAGGGR